MTPNKTRFVNFLASALLLVTGQHVTRSIPETRNNRNRNPSLQIEKDFEAPWSVLEDYWDFIRAGMLCGAVSNWERLYSQVSVSVCPT